MDAQKSRLKTKIVTPKIKKNTVQEGFNRRSSLDSSIPQYFMPDLQQTGQFITELKAQATVNLFNQTRGIDEQESFCLTLELEQQQCTIDWAEAYNDTESKNCFSRLPTEPAEKASFAETPTIISEDKKLRNATKLLKDWLYHENKLELYRCKSPKLESTAYESLTDFKIRLADKLNDSKEIAIEKL